MKITGYNRFQNDNDFDTSPSILVLTKKDLKAKGDDIKEVTLKARGTRPDICLIPKKYKENFLQNDVIKSLMGCFMMGGVMKTKFQFYY
jgi:hypothetical protein